MRAIIVRVLLCALCALPAAAQPVTLVEDGRSDFAIVHAPDSPPSVTQAAQDLQSYILRATGAELPIATEAHEPAIILGAATGLDTGAMPLEGFRIVTRDGNLLIAGPDTAEGERTPEGGTSAGTRNGVYALLERYLGVRWLMPGEHGDHVPTVETLTIPETDWQDAPFFANRRLPYVHPERPEVQDWLLRQRVAILHGPEGQSLQLYHGHNWKTVPPEAFEAHPEWFAEHGGERMPPTGEYKLCVSNPEVVEQFAQAAMKRFAEGATVFSLSPSDGGGWCECENCRAGYFTPEGARRQVTGTILHFYNAVAERVAPEYPDRLLCGYVYQDYVYPPPETIAIHPNVFLVWAPDFDYGFKLYRPEVQDLWQTLAPQWATCSRNIAYYDLPNCVHNSIGAPNPPGTKILQFIYPRLKELGFRGVYVYGNQAWGHSALMNYLLAKLAWDPEADVEALTNDFLAACYAEGAEEIGALYRLLDEATETWYVENASESYNLSEGRMRAVYAANFPEIERLYRAAEGKITDESARVRLERLGANLALLHGSLRQFGMIAEPQTSSFYLDNVALREFIDANRNSIYFFPMRGYETPEAVQKRFSVLPAGSGAGLDEVEPFRFRGRQHLILRQNSPGPLGIIIKRLNARGSLPTCVFYDAEGNELLRDALRPNDPLVLEPTDSEYYHAWVEAGGAFYELQIEGADWAVSDAETDRGVHFLGDLTPMYFYVPEGTESFSIWMAAGPPGETAAGVLYAPDGREAATFDCTRKSIDERQIAVGAGDAGWWKLVPTEPATGTVDDVWVRLGDELPGWFCLDPQNALIVTPE
ncbi:MAG: DUF4838 domain-containing protein [candidate division WS1 bacterium]|jgi:hypothetical protein|nr:DUF4838 domain-containing protein [candidate division WS1 bacterium]